MIAFIKIAWLCLALPATGILMLRLLRGRAPDRVLELGFGIALGFAVTILTLYLPLAAFGRVWFWPTLLLHLGATIWFLARWVPAFLDRWDERRVRSMEALVLIGFGVLVLGANSVPFRGYDSKATFGLKAKALLYEGDLAGPIFQNVDVVHYHPDYPLGVPLLMAFAGWVAEGRPEDPTGAEPARTAAEWIDRHDAVDAYWGPAQLFWIGMFLIVWGWARRRTGSPVASALLFAIALPAVVAVPAVGHSPVIADWRSFGDADRPLVLLLGAMGFAYVLGITRRERSWLLVGAVCAAGAVALKNEALLAVLALAAATFFIKGRRPHVLPAGWLAGAALASMGLVSIVQSRTAGAPFDEDFATALKTTAPHLWLERIPELLDATRGTLRFCGTWYFWWTFLLVGVPIAWRRGHAGRVLCGWVLLYLLISMGAVLVTPNHLLWQSNTAMNRLWFHMAIPAGLLIIEAFLVLWSARPQRSGYSPALPSAPG